MRIWVRIVFSVTILLLLFLGTSLSRIQAAPSTVGNGTPASCTEQAFDKALTKKAPITFNCGAQPFTLVVTSTKRISSNIVIDGGKKITLSGGKKIRVLWIDSNAT